MIRPSDDGDFGGGHAWIDADPGSHAVEVNFQYSDGEVNTMLIDDFDLALKLSHQLFEAIKLAFPDQLAELETDDDLQG